MDLKVSSQGGQNNLTSMGNDTVINVQANREVGSTGDTNQSSDADREYTKKDLSKAVEKLNKLLEDDNTFVEYDVHEKFGDVMIKIVDKTTKEVILEVPPKKVLDMVAKLCEIVGVLFDKKA